MNIYCLERSGQGISTLTMDECLTKAAVTDANIAVEEEEDVWPFDPKGTAAAKEEGKGKWDILEKSTSKRSIVSTTKKTTKTTTTIVDGQKVTTTVVIEDPTPEELERMTMEQRITATGKTNDDDSNNEKRGRRRHRHSARAVVGGVLERITRSLSRGASAARRSLSRGSATRRGSGIISRHRSSASDKKEKSSKKKKDKKGKGQVYVREDGKKVRRVKKKDKPDAMQEYKVGTAPSSDQGDEESREQEGHEILEGDMICPDLTLSLTTGPSVELEAFIGPAPSPEASAEGCEMNTDQTSPVSQPTTWPEEELESAPHIFIGPQPYEDQHEPSIPLKLEQEEVVMVGPMLPNDDWKERAANAAMTAKTNPPTSTVLNSLIKEEETQRGTVPAWRLQATAAAKNRAAVPPFMVQQSVNVANNPGMVPAWKKRAQAAATAAAKKSSGSSPADPSRPPQVVQQSIDQAANQGIPVWKDKAKASATAAVAKKLDERQLPAGATAAVPEWKQKLLEKKKQRLLELEQIKAEASAGGPGAATR